MKTSSIVLTLLFSTIIPHALTAQIPSTEFSNTKHIEVTGSAEMEVVPDEIYVNFNFQEYLNKSKVKVMLETIQQEFLDSCQLIGVPKENIEVGNIGGIDLNNWRPRKNPDFRASVQIVVKFSESTQIHKILARVNEDAVVSINLVKLDHSKIEDFRRQLRIQALQDAKTKAQYLCESIGEKPGEALVIQEKIPQPLYNYNAAYYTDGIQMNENSYGSRSWNDNYYSTQIQFKSIKLKVDVRALFALQ